MYFDILVLRVLEDGHYRRVGSTKECHADVRVMPQYLDEAWARLYPAFLDLPGERAPAP